MNYIENACSAYPQNPETVADKTSHLLSVTEVTDDIEATINRASQAEMALLDTPAHIRADWLEDTDMA